MLSINDLIYLIPSIIIALTIHEAAHAVTAMWLGDHTAKREGRVSLNPIKHLDLLGSLLFLIAGIGWGKPVPINPHNFINPKRDQALVALAGPMSNLLMAAMASIPLKFAGGSLSEFGMTFVFVFLNINITLCALNLLPIPPLDGSKILSLFLPTRLYYKYEDFIHANVSYVLILFFADIYLLKGILGFSIIQTTVGILSGLLKTLIFV
jgi:Zn-dependent protease